MEIVYWSDYNCPFCYIGKTNLNKAIEELGIEDLNITMKAFELEPMADTVATRSLVDHYADIHDFSTEQALERINSITHMAKEAGIDNFDYINARTSNTFDAHRLTKLAAERGLEEEVVEKLFKAYFVNHKELANPETLIEAGVEAGLNQDEIKDLLDSDKFSQEVRNEELIAQQNRIHSVPFFIIDEKYAVPGALPVEQMKEVLTKAME